MSVRVRMYVYHLKEESESAFESAVGFNDEWSGREPAGALNSSL